MNLRGTTVDESVPSKFVVGGIHRHYRPCDVCSKTRGCAHQEEIVLGCGGPVDYDEHYRWCFCQDCGKPVPLREMERPK